MNNIKVGAIAVLLISVHACSSASLSKDQRTLMKAFRLKRSLCENECPKQLGNLFRFNYGLAQVIQNCENSFPKANLMNANVPFYMKNTVPYKLVQCCDNPLNIVQGAPIQADKLCTSNTYCLLPKGDNIEPYKHRLVQAKPLTTILDVWVVGNATHQERQGKMKVVVGYTCSF